MIGRPGADVGLVEEVLLAQRHLRHQRRVPAPRQRVGALVRRDDVKVGVDERRIRVDHRRVGRAVDQRRVRQLERRQAAPPGPPRLMRPRDAPSAVFQFARSTPAGDTTNRRLLASATTRDVEPARQEVVPLLPQLLDERAADVADTDNRQRQPLPRFEERLVNRVERPHLVRRIDDARDVALRCALRDRVDVDVVPSKGVEQLPRDARPPFHALAHHGENGLIGPVVDHHQLIVHFVAEFLFDGFEAAPRVAAPDGEADRVLRRRLGDQDHVDPAGRERPEQPLRDPGHADHARPAQRQQRQAVDGRDALGHRLRRTRPPCSK